MPVYAVPLIQEHTLRLRVRDTTPILRNQHNTLSTVKSKKYTSYPSFLGQGNVFGSGTRYAVPGHSAESRSNPSVQQHTLWSSGKPFSSGAHKAVRRHILQPRGTRFGPMQENALEFSHFLLSGANDFSPGAHNSVYRHFQIYETTPPVRGRSVPFHGLVTSLSLGHSLLSRGT